MNKMKLKILFVLFLSLPILFQPITSTVAQNTVSYSGVKGKLLITHGTEPIIDIIYINQSSSVSYALIVFLTHFESYLINKSDQQIQLQLNISFGLNQNAYVWKVRMDQNGNFITALSNGTIFSFTLNGIVNWSKQFSNKDISNLNVLKNGLFVAISDSGNIFWFNPSNGVITKNFSINNTYFTVSKSFDNYFVAGNDNGSIFVFNSTQYIFNKSIGLANQQVLSIAINQNYIAAFCYKNSLTIFSTVSGQQIPIESYKDIGYDSLFLFENTLYLSQTSGQLIAFNLTSKSVSWSDLKLYIGHLIIAEFTGDNTSDLITLSNDGKLFTLNLKNGTVSHSDTISSSQITTVVPLQLNDDNITDLLIGTYSGEFFIYAGKDYTPPIIIEGSLSYSETDSSITVSFLTNELSVGSISYYNSNNPELIITNNSYLFNHSFTLNNLKSNTNYSLVINLKDKSGNNDSTALIIKTKPSPPPYALYSIVGGLVIIGAIGSVYFVQKRNQRKKAFIEAEKYYEAGEYILAIKSYIKANNKEKIIDIVVFLASNPQLSSFVDEIKQMEELSSYMIDIQEIIQNQEI